jgi:putative ABC transport system substrate-binding protein
MQRREFIIPLRGAAVSWPPDTRAQQPMMPLIGYLGPTSPESYPHVMAAFHQGLKETGYTEGQNVAIEYRWAQGQYDRLPALPTELMSRKASLIVTVGG